MHVSVLITSVAVLASSVFPAAAFATPGLAEASTCQALPLLDEPQIAQQLSLDVDGDEAADDVVYYTDGGAHGDFFVHVNFASGGSASERIVGSYGGEIVGNHDINGDGDPELLLMTGAVEYNDFDSDLVMLSGGPCDLRQVQLDGAGFRGEVGLADTPEYAGVECREGVDDAHVRTYVGRTDPAIPAGQDVPPDAGVAVKVSDYSLNGSELELIDTSSLTTTHRAFVDDLATVRCGTISSGAPRGGVQTGLGGISQQHTFGARIAAALKALLTSAASVSSSSITSSMRPGVQPVRVEIEAIGVDAVVIELGLQHDDTLEVPDTGDEAGWWTGGARPGQAGPAVVAGHVDSHTGPGVFYALRDLKKGDEIRLTDASGEQVAFVVADSEQHDKDDFPTEEVYGHTVEPTLRLVTCGGLWDDGEESYRDNVIVFATLADHQV